MKRLILIAIAVVFSTLTLWAQTGPVTATPNQSVSTRARNQHHRNKQHNHRRHPHHHTGINARR